MVDSAAKMEGTTSNNAKPADDKKNHSNLDEAEITRKVDAAKSQASQGDTAGALEALLAVEKQCRLAEDAKLSKDSCIAILDVCLAAGDWQGLMDNITLLSKRRGQLKATIQVMVRRAAEMLDSGRSIDEQKDLIKTLQSVTEGKIFVEIERARLTRRLARILEGEEKIAQAADAMQEVAVETFGAMHRSEKIAYVLEQMRLCMDNNDFIRAQILSRKVSPKAFAPGQKGQEAGEISLQGTAIEEPEEGTPSMSELKHIYYRQMIRFHKQSNNYLEVVRSLLSIYEDLKGSADRWQAVFKQIVWCALVRFMNWLYCPVNFPPLLHGYLVLCPAYSTAEGSASDYHTLCKTVSGDPHLADLADHKDLLDAVLRQEVSGVAGMLARHGAEMDAEEDIFGGEDGAARREDFKKRITEHNIMVVAKYYSRLSLDRLATVLGLSKDEAEESLAGLVIKHAVAAKIDRPAGIVCFTPAQGPVQVLDHWAESISKLLGLVETTCQKIQKESMQHNVPIGTGA